MTIRPARLTMSSRKRSAMRSCRYRREPATQLCPLAPKMPAMEPLTALSRSASSNTTNGDLPPSSSETSAKFSAEFRTTWRAELGPPVKLTRATSGWEVSARPQGSPWPVTMLTTPGGMPASSISRPNSSIAADACSDALSTTVLPAASAGPSLTATRKSWEFHGTTAATTPSGSRAVKTQRSGLSMGRVAPCTLSAHPAKKWKKSAMYFACQRVSLSILPVSTVSVRPSCSDRSARRSASRRRLRPRSVGVVCDHGPSVNARCAASTARPTSAAVASGMTAQGSPVAGFMLSKVPPSPAFTHAPSISIR